MLHDAYDLSFYEFDDEKDPKEYGVLLCDVVHGRPPMKPAYMGIGWYWYYHGIRYGAETLSVADHPRLGLALRERLPVHHGHSHHPGGSERGSPFSGRRSSPFSKISTASGTP